MPLRRPVPCGEGMPSGHGGSDNRRERLETTTEAAGDGMGGDAERPPVRHRAALRRTGGNQRDPICSGRPFLYQPTRPSDML